MATGQNYDNLSNNNSILKEGDCYYSNNQRMGIEIKDYCSQEPKLLVKELIRLAKMRPLKPAQVDRAKMLMSSLKLISGYRNKEICQAVKGSWSESTIKLYTRGIISSKSRTIPAWKTDLTRLLLSLI